jgi:hypothetical protein
MVQKYLHLSLLFAFFGVGSLSATTTSGDQTEIKLTPYSPQLAAVARDSLTGRAESEFDVLLTGFLAKGYVANIPWPGDTLEKLAQVLDQKTVEKLAREVFIEKGESFVAPRILGPEFSFDRYENGEGMIGSCELVEGHGTPDVEVYFGLNTEHSDPFFIDLGVNIMDLPNNLTPKKDKDVQKQLLAQLRKSENRWPGQENRILVCLTKEGEKYYLTRISFSDFEMKMLEFANVNGNLALRTLK